MADDRAPSGLPIVCSGVAIGHNGTRVLRDVDLTIGRGACTFILGPNGAGKSTLLRVLHGLARPTAGVVTRGGGATRPAGHAMVFQRAVLLRRSAAANIRYALTLADVTGAEADARIADALAEVGLAALAARSARVLSGGEPTASLDPKAARAVEDVVRGIHARGTTVVMTTHNLAQAKRLAADVVFLHEGRLVEHSPAADFFTSPRTREAAAFLEGERL
jgi:tungstate transport system ATP-binding protein